MRRIIFTALLVLLIPLSCAWALTSETIIHTENSLYRNIVVYEQDGERCMRFSRSQLARQTCINLSNPDIHVFAYTRMMLGGLYLKPDPKKILIIGLGGGTLPTTLSRVVPNAEIDSVEIDPAVVKVSKKYFNFNTTLKVRVHEEDGRVFIKKAGKRGIKYDMVMLDAYDSEYIPEHLLTREFLIEVKKVLTSDGVLIANTHSTSGLYSNESVTYEAVFGRYYNLRRTNRVILLKVDGLPTLQEITKNAKLLEARLQPFGVGAKYLLPLFTLKKDWDGGARVLTDQYSPSNLLNAR
ncbi:MAG: spermidine synthase [Desulfuromonadaceae bacterium]